VRRSTTSTTAEKESAAAGLAAATVILALNNVLGRELPGAAYVPVNLATGALLVAITLLSGASVAGLGLGRADARRGLAVGGAIALAVAVVLAIGVALPAARALFEDERAAGLDGGGLAYDALVRIPFGTAFFEELAFRGVLLALLLRVTSTAWAVATSSALFGLWHILPTLSALDINDVDAGLAARAAAVAGAVVATAIGGAIFCWLRLRTRSLLAPVIVHTATNSFAIVGAYVVQRME
jgi:membrane protease YdiL (CAAX protease family)